MEKSGERLIGEYSYSIDPKRRMFIPANFRISKSWIITAGLDNCLFLFPEGEWGVIQEKIRNLPITKKDARGFLRLLLSRANSLNCDAQGRIVLPEKLLKYAEIAKVCIAVGMISRIELWNPKIWAEYTSNIEKDFTKIAEKIADLDL